MTATVRPGIVGPGAPGHRVFEGNFVVECTCGDVIQVSGSKRSARDVAAMHVRSGAWRYDGTGPLFDAGETICHAHADFRLGYHPDCWTPAPDDGSCFICAEDANIANGERLMS